MGLALELLGQKPITVTKPQGLLGNINPLGALLQLGSIRFGWCSGTAAQFPRRRLGVKIQSEAGSSGHQAVIGRGSH